MLVWDCLPLNYFENDHLRHHLALVDFFHRVPFDRRLDYAVGDFVVFVLVGSLLVLNLIVGKVVALYSDYVKRDALMMTSGQAEWILVRVLVMRSE